MKQQVTADVTSVSWSGEFWPPWGSVWEFYWCYSESWALNTFRLCFCQILRKLDERNISFGPVNPRMPLVSCEGEPAALIPEWNCGSTWTWARRTIGRSSVWRRPAAAWGSITTLFLFFLFLFTIFLFLRWQLGCTFVTFLENLTCRENCRPVSKVFSFHCVYLLISFSTLFKKKKKTTKKTVHM